MNFSTEEYIILLIVKSKHPNSGVHSYRFEQLCRPFSVFERTPFEVIDKLVNQGALIENGDCYHLKHSIIEHLEKVNPFELTQSVYNRQTYYALNYLYTACGFQKTFHGRLNKKDLDIVEFIERLESKFNESDDFIQSEIVLSNLRSDFHSIKLDVAFQNYNSFKSLFILFAPTGQFQEHSIANGWSDEYLILASEFDMISRDL